MKTAGRIYWLTERSEKERKGKRILLPLFSTVEEAVINAMVAAETMEGINGNKAYALPHKAVIEVLKKYNRIK